MKVNFYATFRQIVGGKTVQVPMPDGSTVSQLVSVLLERYPALSNEMFDKNGKMYSHVHIFINGRDAPYLPKALETVITESDSIDIFPPVGGG